jgi:hypothetical protein
VCAWEQKNYEMNKCLSLVHLTSTLGPQSSGLDKSTSQFLRRQNLTWIRRAPVVAHMQTNDLDPSSDRSIASMDHLPLIQLLG